MAHGDFKQGPSAPLLVSITVPLVKIDVFFSENRGSLHVHFRCSLCPCREPRFSQKKHWFSGRERWLTLKRAHLGPAWNHRAHGHLIRQLMHQFLGRFPPRKFAICFYIATWRGDSPSLEFMFDSVSVGIQMEIYVFLMRIKVFWVEIDVFERKSPFL